MKARIPLEHPLASVVLWCAGFALLVLTVAGLDGSRFWRVGTDREAAVARARERAPATGVIAAELQTWEAHGVLRRDRSAEVYLSHLLRRGRAVERPGALGDRAGNPPGLIPLSFDLRLAEPHGVRTVEARLAPEGALRALSLRPAPTPEETPEEVAEAVAGSVLLGLVGDSEETAAHFETYDVDPGEGITRYRWRWVPDDHPQLQLNARVQIRGARPVVQALESVVDIDLLRALEQRGLVEDSFTALWLLAAALYLLATLRYHLPHRRALLVGGAIAFLTLGRVLLTFRHRAFVEDGVVGPFLGALVSEICYGGLMATLLFGAGQVALRHACPWQVEGLELFLRRRWKAKTLWHGVRHGLLLGVPLALAPYLVALVFPGFLLFGATEEILSARSPALAAVWPHLSLIVLGQLVVVEPVSARLLRRRLLSRTVAVVVGAFLLAMHFDAAATVPELLVAGLLTALVLDVLFHRFGLPAALVATTTANSATAVAVLVLMPGEFRLAGLLAVALLTAGLAAISLVAGRARADRLEAKDLEIPRRLRAERERIKAQLSVAREAQMRMLPAAPPELPGFQLAASCRPAKEVGGDLYDFIPLTPQNGDAPWAIALGDVSGKGMVASLYMTLTKGLLLAAAEDGGEPCAMLAEVNQGLYQESDRNIFVTLWYGVLHPQSRRLRHVRAGHNPALWRRASQGETVPLRPPGFALGGTSSKLFNRLLKAEEITLEEGDGLFIYSDGLTEAMNAELEEYGDHRLHQAVVRTDGMSAERAMNAILADVHAFMGDAPQHDDMTIVVLRVG